MWILLEHEIRGRTETVNRSEVKELNGNPISNLRQEGFDLVKGRIDLSVGISGLLVNIIQRIAVFSG